MESDVNVIVGAGRAADFIPADHTVPFREVHDQLSDRDGRVLNMLRKTLIERYGLDISACPSFPLPSSIWVVPRLTLVLLFRSADALSYLRLQRSCASMY